MTFKGDGKDELLVGYRLYAPDGKILFRKTLNHAQHALIGRFRPDLPGKQVFFINRNEGTPGGSRNVLEVFYSKSGELLWDNSKQKEEDKDGWVTQGVTVENWTGNPNENFVCLNRRGIAPPALLDGWGREVAVFPFPAGITQKAAGPGQKDRYDGYYVKHFNCYGDEREEILVYDRNALYIYINAALREKPELFNDTIYNGRK